MTRNLFLFLNEHGLTSLTKTLKPQISPTKHLYIFNLRYSVDFNCAFCTTVRYADSRTGRTSSLNFRVKILCMKSAWEKIHSGELVGKSKLLKCPEGQVQGSIDTSPSSHQREGSIKSVSVKKNVPVENRQWLICLLASRLNALSWFA